VPCTPGTVRNLSPTGRVRTPLGSTFGGKSGFGNDKWPWRKRRRASDDNQNDSQVNPSIACQLIASGAERPGADADGFPRRCPTSCICNCHLRQRPRWSLLLTFPSQSSLARFRNVSKVSPVVASFVQSNSCFTDNCPTFSTLASTVYSFYPSPAHSCHDHIMAPGRNHPLPSQARDLDRHNKESRPIYSLSVSFRSKTRLSSDENQARSAHEQQEFSGYRRRLGGVECTLINTTVVKRRTPGTPSAVGKLELG